jgi:hypothetical protein
MMFIYRINVCQVNLASFFLSKFTSLWFAKHKRSLYSFSNITTPFGLPPGSLRAPSGLPPGSIRAPSGLPPGSLRAPSGLPPGSLRAPSGLPPGSLRAPSGSASFFQDQLSKGRAPSLHLPSFVHIRCMIKCFLRKAPEVKLRERKYAVLKQVVDDDLHVLRQAS